MSTTRQRDLLLTPLATPDDLHRWIRLFCNLSVPRAPVVAGHSAPFDYVVRAYFEPAQDQVVHAPRGGGKTRLAAVATLLDLLHKPGVSVRILGGSLEQSLRLWEHLLPDLTHAARDLIDKRTTKAHRVTLSNGSTCAVLTQSEKSVRGLRVQKLRCDEVELFDPDVWEAAQLVTKSLLFAVRGSKLKTTNGEPRTTKDVSVYGSIDALSTLHEPFGLMQRVLDRAEHNGTPIVHWSILDVLARCEPERSCDGCALWEECQGTAKVLANGFVPIDDAIRMKRRVSLEQWRSEMLCERPGVRAAVFPTFEVATHVVPHLSMRDDAAMSYAVDFGYAAPFVCLFVRSDAARTYVVDEYVRPGRTIDEHVAALHEMPWPEPTHVACDPAGDGANEQTGVTSVQKLRRAGFCVRHRPSRILDGVEQVRAALRPAAGEPTLFVHPRCTRLIRALQGYRYPTAGTARELPLKDGEHDHLIDALRYHFVNAHRRGLVERAY